MKALKSVKTINFATTEKGFMIVGPTRQKASLGHKSTLSKKDLGVENTRAATG